MQWTRRALIAAARSGPKRGTPGDHPNAIRLVDLGIRGNGHDMTIEKSNPALAAVTARRLTAQGR